MTAVARSALLLAMVCGHATIVRHAAAQASFVQGFDNVGQVQSGQGGPSNLIAQGWIFRNLFLSWAAPINASLFYAIAFILLWLFLMWLLYRKRIYIKV